jgi:hypothetical protein
MLMLVPENCWKTLYWSTGVYSNPLGSSRRSMTILERNAKHDMKLQGDQRTNAFILHVLRKPVLQYLKLHRTMSYCSRDS